jgi:hypothetical protein
LPFRSPSGAPLGRGFHRARNIFGATPRHLGDWASVRRIFNFEPLTWRGLGFAILVTAGIVISVASSEAAFPRAALLRARSIDRVEFSLRSVSRRRLPVVGLQPQ